MEEKRVQTLGNRTQQNKKQNNQSINKKNKQKAQTKMNKIMTEITKELLAIEDEQRKSMQSKFGGQNMRHRWSDTFGNRTGTMKLLIRVNQMARTKKKEQV